MLTPTIEYWYCWREFSTAEGEHFPRLLVPWSDPDVYEHPADGLFETEEDAQNWKLDLAPYEEWILCRLAVEPMVGWKQCSKCNEVKLHTLEQPTCMNCMEEEAHGRGENERPEDETKRVRPGRTEGSLPGGRV